MWSDIEKVIRYSQGYAEEIPIDLTEIKEKWRRNKQRFLDMWGGEIFTCPYPVSFTLDENERVNIVLDFCNWIERHYKNIPLSNFVWYERNSFFDNKVTRAPGDEGVKLGMKITKAFRYYEENKDILTDIRNEASRAIQKDKIEGTLVFSVHPLDFLSISETTYNWRTCHALDGDYRLGNLNYMTDTCTVVCYIRDSSGNKYKLPNFPESVPWYSKKWRTLLYLGDYSAVASRQYPFTINGALEHIDNELNKDWNKSNFHFPSGDWQISDRESLRNYIINAPHTAQFNDVLNSSSYKEIIHKPIRKNSQSLTIGEPVSCLSCGSYPPAGSDTFLCLNCEMLLHINYDTFVCDCCGRTFPTDDEEVTFDGWSVCPGCRDAEATYCEMCGDLVLYDAARYSHKEDAYYCPSCWVYIDDSEEE